MIVWRDILVSLKMVEASTPSRLDDPATMLCRGEYIPMDLLEIEIDEIGDDRLVAVPLTEIDDGK